MLACCRPIGQPGRPGAVRAAAAAPIDPDRLLDLAQVHRVEGLIEQALRDAGVALPDAAQAVLSARAGQRRHQLMALAVEETRVATAFAAAGIDCLFLKGATLAVRAHGSLGAKSSKDIDMLIDPGDIDAAVRLLQTAGYRLCLFDGRLDERTAGRWIAAKKETSWVNDRRRIELELHVTLADGPRLIPAIGMHSPRQPIAFVPGKPVETLADVELFAYLCVHGTGHGWERLKWLADLAALIETTAIPVENLHDQAVAMGAGRCPRVALYLAATLLGTDLPPTVRDAIRRDRLSRGLIRMALTLIRAAASRQEQLRRPMATTWALSLVKYGFVPGTRYRAAMLWHDLTQPHSRGHLALPNWAMPAYTLAWIPARIFSRPWRQH
ncbi:nucleotidyltransferase family protein [Sphingomonas sp. 28-63-12]|uniref:nucleotidyltransferase domain-containing protein n=1 Tax=Sphingomonas sp. 28-63-12 TaxID=1970434 RepID=UPI0035A8F117